MVPPSAFDDVWRNRFQYMYNTIKYQVSWKLNKEQIKKHYIFLFL